MTIYPLLKKLLSEQSSNQNSSFFFTCILIVSANFSYSPLFCRSLISFFPILSSPNIFSLLGSSLQSISQLLLIRELPADIDSVVNFFSGIPCTKPHAFSNSALAQKLFMPGRRPTSSKRLPFFYLICLASLLSLFLPHSKSYVYF